MLNHTSTDTAGVHQKCKSVISLCVWGIYAYVYMHMGCISSFCTPGVSKDCLN